MNRRERERVATMSRGRKIYVHYEREGHTEEDWTVVMMVQEDVTLSVFLRKFLDQLETRLQCAVGTEQCKVRSESSALPLTRDKPLLSLLEDDESDLFVKVNLQSKPGKSEPVRAASATATISVPASASVITRPHNTVDDAKREEISRNVEISKTLDSLMQRRQYRKAMQLVQEMVTASATTASPPNATLLKALKCSAEIHLQAHRYEEVIRLVESVQRMSLPPLAGVQSLWIELQTMHGIALMKANQFESAVQVFTRVKALWDADLKRSSWGYIGSEEFSIHVTCLLAQVVFLMGHASQAANLLNALMESKLSEVHLALLVTYAEFSFRYRNYSDALNALLKAISLDQVKNPNTPQLHCPLSYLQWPAKKVKILITELLCESEGLDAMIKFFPPNSRGTAEVYGYLASTAKDHSAIDLCIRLYTLALQTQPNNAHYALNLVHAHEIKLDYEQAVEEIVVFLAKNLQLSVGRDSSAPVILSCAQIVAALKQDPPAECGESVTDESQHVDNKEKDVVRFQTHGMRWVEDAEQPYAVVDRNSEKDDSGLTITLTEFPVASVVYSQRELDLLGFFVTTVKVLFLAGKLSNLPTLIALIEPIRRLSKVPLHRTNFRNEVAYYTHIVQILSQRNSRGLYGLPSTVNAFADPLRSSLPFFQSVRCAPVYVCGDSHCLSPAWSCIRSHGEQRLLIPRLVTGIKQFHLRDESQFYPKENFIQAVSSIPSQSDVIFVIGEIDCREGFLVALEKDIYQSLEEGMTKTIAYFTKVLLHLRESKRFRMFIHPVPPVLTETRPIVCLFNWLYKQAILDLKDESIVWMDFAADLLTNKSPTTDLKSCYRHDGTHLSVEYVQLIEEAIDHE